MDIVLTGIPAVLGTCGILWFCYHGASGVIDDVIAMARAVNVYFKSRA